MHGADDKGKTRREASSRLYTLVAIVVAIAALQVAREILLPVALATLLSFLLTPLANRLERFGLPRGASVIVTVGLAFVVLGGLGWVVSAQLADLSAKLPQYRNNVLAKVHTLVDSSAGLSRVADALEDVQRELASDGKESPSAPATSSRPRPGEERGAPPTAAVGAGKVEAAPRVESEAGSEKEVTAAANDSAVAVKVVSMPPSPLTQIQAWLGPLVAPLTTAGIVVVLAIFLLLQREDQRNRLLRLFGTSNLHATTEALADIADRVTGYLRMQFLINAGYGVCVGLGMLFIGVPNAVMWGVLSFSLRFLPYLGPWISAVMPIAVSLAISDGWTQPLVVVAWFITLELIVNNFVEPYLYGNTVGVSGVGVILAAILWTWLWGPIGLVLAMPLTVCVVVAAQYIPSLRFITILLGDQPTLMPEERIYQRLLAFDFHEAERLAGEHVKRSTLAEWFDGVLVKALNLAERDRHAGLLSEEQEDFVADSVDELVDGAADPKREKTPDEDDVLEVIPVSRRERPPRVLCIPLRDRADEIAGAMLRKLLADEHLDFDIAAPESLTGEVVDRAGTEDLDMVVVSIVPPLPFRASRLLCRRLRERRPELPILVGLWGAQATEAERSTPTDAELVVSLADAVERIRAAAVHWRMEPRVEPIKGAPPVVSSAN